MCTIGWLNSSMFWVLCYELCRSFYVLLIFSFCTQIFLLIQGQKRKNNKCKKKNKEQNRTTKTYSKRKVQ